MLCTAKEGWYQEEDTWFSHITFELSGAHTSTEWCDPMNDEVYEGLTKDNVTND